MASSRPRRSDPTRTTLVDVATDDWLVGKVVDERYRVERVLGEGGMGRVYEVTDTAFHRRAVLKTLLPGLSQDATTWPRFLREARAAADLGSPHIVAVQEFGDLDDGRSYYVMELADGVSLETVLDEAHGPLPLERALRITRGVTRALEVAHEAKIVHRDLKPDNVLLVVRNGQADFVKIVDFGLALMMDAAVRITGNGELVGSPYYMSPEQCADDPVDGRADIYALGVMLFEMLTLDLPFDGQMVKVLQDKIMSDPPAPSERDAVVPAEVDELVLKCIAKSPDDRFQSAQALGEALDALIGRDEVPRGFTSAPVTSASAFSATSGSRPPEAPPRATPSPPRADSPVPAPPRSVGATVGLLVAIFVAAAVIAGVVALAIN